MPTNKHVSLNLRVRGRGQSATREINERFSAYIQHFGIEPDG